MMYEWENINPREEGGGGYSRFQVTGMMEWRQKSKPSKIPRVSNKTQRIPRPMPTFRQQKRVPVTILKARQ